MSFMEQRNAERDLATDIADEIYKTGKYPAPQHIGRAALPVLMYLWNTPWNNFAQGLIYTLRPTSVRVVGYNDEEKTDSRGWRVTVRLAEDGRTIQSIEQEVDIGMVGCRHGSDVYKALADLEKAKNNR